MTARHMAREERPSSALAPRVTLLELQLMSTLTRPPLVPRSGPQHTLVMSYNVIQRDD